MFHIMTSFPRSVLRSLVWDVYLVTPWPRKRWLRTN